MTRNYPKQPNALAMQSRHSVCVVYAAKAIALARDYWLLQDAKADVAPQFQGSSDSTAFDGKAETRPFHSICLPGDAQMGFWRRMRRRAFCCADHHGKAHGTSLTGLPLSASGLQNDSVYYKCISSTITKANEVAE
jgi:hypothetical protein